MKGENGGDLICDANKEEEGKKEVLFTRRLRRPGQREPRLGEFYMCTLCTLGLLRGRYLYLYSII